MADQEQLERLKQGVNGWNEWIKQYPETPIDLNGANLSTANLNGADLSHADLSHADLNGANLSTADLNLANLNGADLIDADLNGAYLIGADLSHANLSHANLSTANLSLANLGGANLSLANLGGANLSLADLSHADLSHADLSGADLSGADLSGANLSGANLLTANLIGAKLSYADLTNAKLSGADLTNANLIGANLSYADLSGADLSGADLLTANLIFANLSGADLSGADLSGANLSGANLSGANLSGAIIMNTSFGDQDLRLIKGLETVRHRGPSPLSINTLYKSEGDIPENFLKGTGAPDIFIEYIRSLTMRPIEYYTCFISYSSKDELFAKRLHNDLQQEGVRCWFAPEDMAIGDKIKHRIDESIRIYDKLLLILSEHSIASNWVAYEVERALKKEPHGIPNVLYPVRVDQTILTCTTEWASDIKETRHIGDFEHWTNPQQYEVSFKRLLRALNAKKKP